MKTNLVKPWVRKGCVLRLCCFLVSRNLDSFTLPHAKRVCFSGASTQSLRFESNVGRLLEPTGPFDLFCISYVEDDAAQKGAKAKLKALEKEAASNRKEEIEIKKEIKLAKKCLEDKEKIVKKHKKEVEAAKELLAKAAVRDQDVEREAQKVIPSEVREQFQRMVVAYGPEAMADCTDGVCSNCFVQMTPQSKVLLNNGNSLFCGSCGRLNYLANE